ncbi:nuclear RNA export factor 1-like isoform X2 [Daktulosphaira vitifoliae]|uniref:nuclear RNA export factor 1-like isoform X2 n=1 Tax=Daktulosphaira vitifoliae TaxID=58002 RepID=UPI0021AA06C8|nr:nuclear RNA export factor 1-like isoform X2 [Daktulosphaira vitifoliae]
MAGRSRGRNNRYHVYNNNNTRNNNEHDDRTARPSTSRGGGNYSDRQSFNKRVTFKANNRGGHNFRKSWENKSELVRDQLNNEYPKRNGPSRNNGSRRSFPERNAGGRGSHTNFRTSSWTLKESITGWYAIFVPNVEDGDEVLKIIQTYITPVSFYPYNKRLNNNNLQFLVDDHKVAKTLHNTSYKLSLRDGKKLIIKVSIHLPSRFVNSLTPVPYEIKQKMIEAMSTRYNPNTKSLDLSRFHACQIFTDNQMFVPLNRPTVLLATLNMIAQQTKHDLYGLSLENNYIYMGEGFIWIRRLFPDLKVLDLSGNKFQDIKELSCLSGFGIEVLNLMRNPVADSEDKERYRRDIQQLFPMLNKLDESDLPSRYSAIVGSKLKMPINLGDSYALPEGQNPEQPNPVTALVSSFLTQYYERFDNQISKQLVADAYHENATFSMSSCFLTEMTKGSLGQYLPESRNLIKIPEMGKIKRSRFLHKGKENIVNFLEKLPKTKHDLESFIVDVPIANAAMVQIIVNGVYVEDFDLHKRMTIRSFCRTFAIVPVGSGWSILSDMLFVTLANNELYMETSKRMYVPRPNQGKKSNSNGNNNNSGSMFMDDYDDMGDIDSVYSIPQTATPNYPPTYNHAIFTDFQSSPMPTPSIQPPSYQAPQTFQSDHLNTLQQNTTQEAFQLNIQQTSQSSNPFYNSSATTSDMNKNQSEVNSVVANTSSEKIAMIKRFANDSGMNDEWAERCLNDNGWNYDNAAESFAKLKDNIPAAAFQH